MCTFVIYVTLNAVYTLQALPIHSISTVRELVLGYVGKLVRVILPSCAVTAIRSAFPSDTDQGFKLPALH